MLTPVGAHGEGSITRRKDGRLQVAVTMLNGRRVYRTIPRMRDGKAQRRLAEATRRELVDLRELDLDPSRLTLEGFLRSWVGSLRESGRVRPRTLEFYAMIAERHIIPALGGYPLHRLSERHVQAWLDRDGTKSVHHHRNVLRIALNAAMRQRYVTRNVAVAVDLPKRAEFEGDPLTVDEVKRLLTVTADDPLGPLWRLAVVTGLRSGELLGLARDDVDGNRLTVAHQLTRTPAGWARVGTKVHRRRKVIVLDAVTAEILAAHLRRTASERRPEWRYPGLVFTIDGEPIARWTLLREFHAALARAGVRQRRVHDLRVTSATLMVDQGIDEATRMARLGHRTKDIARHYGLIRDEVDRAASERLAEVIG